MMTARYTVKIAGAGEGGSNLTLDTDNKHDALADAESWHNDGYLVTVHDNRTGKKIYISAIVEGALNDGGYVNLFACPVVVDCHKIAVVVPAFGVCKRVVFVVGI